MRTILFVCTGNTCRSPMAACMMNALCKKQKYAEVCALSAGLRTLSDAPASEGARLAMEKRGLSLAEHHAQPVTQRLLRDVSLVVGMSQAHIAAIKKLYPSVTVPMRAFAPPIPDPYGCDPGVYEQAAQAMEKQLESLLSP
ncbi:MAG: hypothetical protein RSA65_00255 [Clostridia bacterium]